MVRSLNRMILVLFFVMDSLSKQYRRKEMVRSGFNLST